MVNWRIWLVNDQFLRSCHICWQSTVSCILYIPQYGSGSTYSESTDADIPFAEPAEELDDIYDELAEKKCIEIPRVVLK